MSRTQIPVRVFTNPSFAEVAEAISSAASKGRAMVILGSCEVRVRGKTNAQLGSGERIVILKEDGSVLVHQVWGNKPVYHEPPGALVYATADAKSVTLFAERRLVDEIMEVVFSTVYMLAELRFKDEPTSEFVGIEATMREAVVYLPEIVERGLSVISQDFSIKSGFVDLLALDNRERLVAIGFKSKSAKTADVNQLIAYVSRLRALSQKRKVRGILVAPGINKSARKLLNDSGLEFKRVDPERCVKLVEELKPMLERVQKIVS
ncbi:hypothetical protein B9Q01_03905 [Candidatus Marsarchaeota G1 archaeon OSP_D]|jgi:RecB family endonuclease NucS|uniref:Endonuclease NucS n=2 Tax=Candidatus Marsarchaeota group 1 TaxID=2203770 RepID=A0A2R6ABI7_9ARCH|nr:MAG: hypothetical protein B9Q01_03905 [Candidatus Marsarchaeota G1 archaeon OSP_D]PSN88488.1 MAG: hypothetical protein B9Q00_05260 [Candidatus Marsarchaeota G1 archaeon OSP_C]